MKYEKIMKQLKSFNFTDAQRKKLASIILKLDKEKQDILVSGDNIATINGQSLLNGGNISLIKTGIFTIVTELPTNDIDKDKVYLVPSTKTDNENRFSEYIYTDNGWEKLGTFTAEIDLSNYVQKTDVVTNTTNGLMLASDKIKLDAFRDAEQYKNAINLPDSVISNVEYLYKYDNENIRNIIFRCTKNNLIDGSNSTIDLRTPIVSNNASGLIKPIPNNVSGVQFYTAKSNGDSDWTYIYTSPNYNGITLYARGENFESQALIILKNASTVDHGLMSSSDKYKLDSLKNYRAGNGIDITGDTISCTLDTSLYSIVTELPETGLPNKIYLLPSTKTEEGNIYTEYGYVDNKWEEIGKYKADIDLTPYKRALNLPYSVIKGDEISFLGNASKVLFNYKPANLDTGAIPDYKTINFPEATTSFAGTMSASDKIKLDGIEAGAQVNKIESVSVNGTPLEITNKGVDIPNATTEKDGMMSKADKTKINALPSKLIFDFRINQNNKDIDITYLYNQLNGQQSGSGRRIDAATTSTAGVMSASDKAKLDSQPTIKASNATGVTDNDYIVIKKSELNSILSRLSALENKA